MMDDWVVGLGIFGILSAVSGDLSCAHELGQSRRFRSESRRGLEFVSLPPHCKETCRVSAQRSLF